MRAINSFCSMPPRRRWATIGAGVVAAALVATSVYLTTRPSTGPGPSATEFVLGGGTATAGPGQQVEIRGSFAALAVDVHDHVSLFVHDDEGLVRWQQGTSGPATRTVIRGIDGAEGDHTRQAAVAPDGSVYLAAGDLWKVNPDGRATKVIDAGGHGGRVSYGSGPLAGFHPSTVTGVAVGKDGTVYIGDNDTTTHESFVHTLTPDTVTLLAGRERRPGESIAASNPAVRDALDPPAGTRATNVLVPAGVTTGRVAASSDGVYWTTGDGIVRIAPDDTLTPVVAAHDPGSLTTPRKPFETIGHAVDAKVEHGTGATDQEADLAFSSTDNRVFYAAGPESDVMRDGPFHWGGRFSAAQQRLLAQSKGGKSVYQVAGGDLSLAATGAAAMAASPSSLYLVVESASAGPADRPGSRRTAVVRTALPTSD